MTAVRPDFSLLLRSSRVRAGLTQSQLAESADMSLRGVAALEYGERRAPHRETVAALVRALGSTSDEARALEAAANRGRLKPKSVGNLPFVSTSFVGRDRLIEEAETRLARERVLALVGRGGVGKTRAALVLAARLEANFSAGAWLVDLSSVVDERSIVAKIASVISASSGDAGDLRTLCRSLGGRGLLLVLDNCEAVATACASIARAIRAACPSVAIVATSTVELDLGPGALLRVAPLELPRNRTIDTMAGLRSFAAIELFVERCERYGCRDVARDDSVAIVSSICRRLEGLPLALELAASRAANLGLATLEATIERWFECERGTFVDVPVRHRSLFATIDWSHALLDDDERIVLRRLSIFAGDFDMRAAHDVCAAPPLDRVSIRDLVLSLERRSLAVGGLHAGVERWALFDSTRSYAAKKLLVAGERHAIARRHADYFAGFAEREARRYFEEPTSDWLRAIKLENDNIEAALAWDASASGDPDVGARTLGRLRPYWEATGRLRQVRELADSFLARIDPDASPRAAAELLLIRALNLRGRDAGETGRRSIRFFERCGDQFGLAVARIFLATCLVDSRRFGEALDEIDLAATCEDPAGALAVETTPRFALSIHAKRAVTLNVARRHAEARREFIAAREIAVAIHDDYASRRIAIGLAEAAFALGEVSEAQHFAREGLNGTRSAADTHGEWHALANLAAYHVVLGETADAAARIADALALDGDDPFVLACVLEHAATVLALRGRCADAARLNGYVENFRRTRGFEREYTEHRSNEILTDSLARTLSAGIRTRCARSGAALAERDAVRIAMTAPTV